MSKGSTEHLLVELRRHRRNTRIAIIVACVALFFSFAQQPVVADEEGEKAVTRHKVLQAELFELVNSKGELIAAMRAHSETGRPIVALYDDGNPKAGLALNRDGHPILTFQDDKDRQRLRIYLNEEFSGQVDLLDERGVQTVEVKAGIEPQLTMRSGEKKPQVVLASASTGAFLGLRSKASSEVFIGIDENEEPSIELWDKQKNHVFDAPAKQD